MMSDRVVLAGKTALITGAGSGLGRALATSLARRACALALADIDENGLAETLSLLGEPGSRITLHKLDVADAAAVAALPGELLDAGHARVDLLINNAGVSVAGPFEETSDEDFAWLFGINFWGPVRMTRAFLPQLKESAEARIVNISSLFGLIAPPSHSAYCASKFALRGFSQSLRYELERTSVGMTVVHPGGVATRIADSSRLPSGMASDEAAELRKQFNRFLTMTPAEAAEIIVRGVERGRSRIIVGKYAKALALLERLAPVDYFELLAWLQRRLKLG